MKKTKLVLLLTAFAMLGAAQQLQEVKESILYPGITQPPKSYSFYKFSTNQNFSAQSQYIGITVDAEDAQSDPDIYISKTNQNPRSAGDSDQYCVKAGSDICFLKRNSIKANDTFYFGVQCIGPCKYSLKVHYVNVTNMTDGFKNSSRINGRSLSVFKFTIPQISTDGLTKSVYFQIDTYSTQSSIQLYFSQSNELSMIQERDFDLMTESGKALRFNSEDNGWCTNCSVYFIVSTSGSSLYTVSGKSTARNELLQDQIAINRQFNANQNECFGYNVDKSVNDAIFTTKSYQGDINFGVSYRNLSTNQPSNQVIVASESSTSKKIIVRSADRMKFGPSNGLIYLCSSPITDSSIIFSGRQLYSMNRFELEDSTLTTFILDSKDFLYFKFTDYQLSQQQNISISVQSSNSNFSVPRIIYKICNSPIDDECTLTDQEAMLTSNALNMNVLNGTVDNNTNTRLGLINHSPVSCSFPMKCHYLISIYNPDQSGPIKVNLKLEMNNYAPIPISLFQQYGNAVAKDDSHYFQVVFTPQHLGMLNISSLQISLNYFNGRADLFLSTQTSNPNANNYEVVSRSLFRVNQLTFNVAGRDLSQQPIFIGVYGNVYTQYMLQVDAIYQSKYPMPLTPSGPTPFMSNQTNQTNSTSSNMTVNVTSSVLIEGEAQEIFLNQSMTDYIFYIPITPEISRGDRNGKSIIIMPKLILKDQNSTWVYNVTYKNYTWINITDNLIIDQTPFLRFEDRTNVTIRVRGTFKNSTIKNAPKPNMTLSFIAYTSNKLRSTLIESEVNTTFQSYLNKSTVVFKQFLMDSNATYQFTLNNQIGLPSLMVKHGVPLSTMNTDDDASYDYASTVIDEFETQTITVDKTMRENVNSFCKNASFPQKGGNSICTMYIAVQCNSICTFDLTITQNMYANKSMDVPKLLKEGVFARGEAKKNQTRFYYLPLMRNQTGDMVISLNKLNNNSVLVAKIISNAYLPYYSWSYPTNTSFDLMSYSNMTSYEILEISNATFQSKCPNNSSCALIVGVIGNSTTNMTNSSFELTYMTQKNKLTNVTLINQTIEQSGDFNYYWLLINTKNKTDYQKWNYLVTVGINNFGGEIDVYASTFMTRYPTSEDFDFKGEKLGPDMINLNSNDTYFSMQRNRTGAQLLVIVGVKALASNSSFTLMNWGPDYMDQVVFNFTDMMINQTTNYTFLQRSVKEGQYKIFRYFNYGTRDIQLNISCTDGGVYVLANVQPFKSSNKNAFLNVPIFNQTSMIKPISLVKGKFSLIKLSQLTNDTGLWCQFCWQYFAVFQNASTTTQASTVSVKLTEIQDSGMYTPILKFNEPTQTIIILEGSAIQKKFLLSSKQPFVLNVTCVTQGQISIYMGTYSDYLNNEMLWNVTGTTGVNILRVRQSDPQFKVGIYYYVTVVANNRALIETMMTLEQQQPFTTLKDKETILDRMWTSEDFVKYYKFVPPAYVTNYTAQLVIKSRTPGFVPDIYIQKNEFLNVSVNTSRIIYPSMANFTQRFEKPFFLSQNLVRLNSLLIFFHLDFSSSLQFQCIELITHCQSIIHSEVERDNQLYRIQCHYKEEHHLLQHHICQCYQILKCYRLFHESNFLYDCCLLEQLWPH